MLTKLANVDIESSKQFMTCPTMWVSCEEGSGMPMVPHGSDNGGRRHAFVLPHDGTYDFMTYYGSLSLRKWDEYTTAHDYELHVTAKGKYAVTIEYADAYAYPSSVQDGKTYEFTDDTMTRHVIDLGLDGKHNQHGALPVLVGFRIVTGSTDCEFDSVAWFAHADSVRDVSIAICTTTFKKESYVKRNVSKIKETILYKADGNYDDVCDDDAFDEVSRHLYMNVVDNGRTLDARDIDGNGVKVFPNPNAGGAGGFARGMIESIDEGVTHAIMMDDDVSFCTEAFVRTYNLLRIVRDEYADAFVSGGMLSMYDVDMMSEDTGFMSYGGGCQAVKHPMRLSLVHGIIDNETFEPPLYRDECQDIRQQYAAWWYCVIPMTQIKRRGLPLPLFVRYDDVEYALRDNDDEHRHFMTMNGICVWHEPFFMRYDPAVERYQTTRNSLIIRAASDAAPKSDFTTMINETFKLELKRMDYDDAELMCEAVEDYLQGPDVTFAPGFAERRFLETHRTCERGIPFEQARDKLLDFGIDIDDIEPNDVFHDRNRNRFERVMDVMTYMGHDMRSHGHAAGDDATPDAVDAADGQAEKVVIMSKDPGAYQPGEIRNADVIIAIDAINKKVAIRRRDNERFNRLRKRFKHDMRMVQARQSELRDAYHAGAARMHTRGAWELYLGL